jgi:hypothetical protein
MAPSNRCQRCVRTQFGPTGTGSHTQLLPELIEVHHNRGILPFAIQVSENGRPCRSITGLENTLYRQLGIDGALCRHDRLKSVLQPLAIARCFSDLDIGGHAEHGAAQYVRPPGVGLVQSLISAVTVGAQVPPGGLHRDAIRIPMMIVAVVGSLINLYVIWRIRSLWLSLLWFL